MLKILDVIMFMAFLFGIYLLIESYNMNNANAQTIDTEWTEKTQELHTKITKMGVNKELGRFIINECKRTANDPRKCVKTAVAIYGNESSFGRRCKFNSCWGVISKKYTSVKEAARDWIKRYNRNWYRHDGAYFFYGSRGKLGKSRYCTSEKSSNSRVGCPNGAETFDLFFNNI